MRYAVGDALTMRLLEYEIRQHGSTIGALVLEQMRGFATLSSKRWDRRRAPAADCWRRTCTDRSAQALTPRMVQANAEPREVERHVVVVWSGVAVHRTALRGRSLELEARPARAAIPNRRAGPEKDKGPAISREALVGVGRPCRDRTYDQRIKSLSHPRDGAPRVPETKGVSGSRPPAHVPTEPMPNRNGRTGGRVRRLFNRVNDLAGPPPNRSRTTHRPAPYVMTYHIESTVPARLPHTRALLRLSERTPALSAAR